MTDNTQTDSSTRRRRPKDIPLPEEPSENELAIDWSLSTADYLKVARCRGDLNRLRFSLQLCVLRKHCRFLANYSQVPVRIINHLCKQLDLPPLLKLEESERDATEYVQQQRIRDYLKFHSYDERIETELTTWLVDRAVEGFLPEQLYGKAEQLLKSWHVVLPASSTIERLVDSISARAKNDFYEFITARLTDELLEQIDELLGKTGLDGKTILFHLKEYPPHASSKSILEYLGYFKLIDKMLGESFDTGVEPAMQKHLADLAKQYDSSALKQFPKARKYALIICFLAETRKTVLDYIVAMHDQFTLDLTRKSKHKHDGKLKDGRTRAKQGMAILFDATEIIVDSNVPVPKRCPVLFETFSEAELREALEDCRTFQSLEERGLTDELCAHYVGLHRYFPEFLTLNFKGSAGCEPLLSAISLAKSLDASNKKKLPKDAPISFVPVGWRKVLTKDDGTLDRRVWDIALALAIRDTLRSGDLHLAESRKHVSFWNLVYDEQKWEKEKTKAYASLALPSKANDLFADIKNEYIESLEKAKKELSGNTVFTITDGKIHLKKPDALEIPEGTKQLRAAIESNIRHIRIEDLLQEVDRACAFTREFRPLGGYKPRAKNLYITILANLIAQGTNLGIAAMANSVDNLSVDMLQHANQWFFSQESQKAANKVLVDYHHSLPLTELYGKGEMSSSDGQRFGVQQSSLLASFYPRYFGYYDRAITLYTHISDQYSVFSTQAISCGPREALHVLDGLLDNQTVLCPREHMTDTHGFTEQLFGLCYLLGFSFMPRLKDLPDQRLYKFDNSIDMGEFESVFESPIDLALISEQWDQLVRVAASLRNKVAPAHVVLHRLVNAAPSDRVAKALTALGRLVKTVYLMGYIADPALRRKVHKQLNRGEGRHDLAKWLFFANRGVFRTGDYEEIMNKASCLSLLSNAVLVWNTMEIDKMVHSLRLSGQIVNDADLALVAPLLRYHVAPNGMYFNNKAPSNQPIITVFDR